MQFELSAHQAIYKEHSIVHRIRPIPSNENRAGYMAVAFISWTMPDRHRRVMHCLTLSKQYATEQEARAAVLAAAKKWVDEHERLEGNVL